MKKTIILSLLLALSVLGFGQNFEGLLKYDIKYSGDGIDQFAAMLPTSYSLKLSEKFTKLSMEGGMAATFMGDIIGDLKNNITYMLMPMQKTAYKMTAEKSKPEKTPDAKITNTGLNETVGGYKSTKYKIETKAGDETIVTYIWASKDVKATLPQSNASQMPFKSYKEIDGFPVRIVQDMSQMGMSFTTTITLSEVKKEKFADSEFKVPADYKIEAGNPDFGKMMGK